VGSKTVIEKLERYSDVGFVVVLMTPDDVGGGTRTIFSRVPGKMSLLNFSISSASWAGIASARSKKEISKYLPTLAVSCTSGWTLQAPGKRSFSASWPKPAMTSNGRRLCGSPTMPARPSERHRTRNTGYRVAPSDVE